MPGRQIPLNPFTRPYVPTALSWEQAILAAESIHAAVIRFKWYFACPVRSQFAESAEGKCLNASRDLSMNTYAGGT